MAYMEIGGEELAEKIENEYQLKSMELRHYGVSVEGYTITSKFTVPSGVPVSFTDCIFKNDVVFGSGEVNGAIYIRRSNFEGHLQFIDGKFTDKIVIGESELSNVLISATLKSFQVYYTNMGELLIGEAEIERMELGGNRVSKGKAFKVMDLARILYLQVVRYEWDLIRFWGLPKQLEVQSCCINSIAFERVRNDGNVKILNCKSLSIPGKLSHFSIHQSNLGKAEFFKIDFASFNEVNIISSVLYDCLFLNTNWRISNITSFAGDQMDDYLKDRKQRRVITRKIFFQKRYVESKAQLLEKRETLKQIKFALGKQGDVVNEQLFHSFEMNTYSGVLKWFSRDFFTKLILFFSRYSSNYGQSLFRPIAFLLLINGLLFNCLYFRGVIACQTDVIDLIGEFIRFQSPFHKNDELKGLDIVIDTLMRIISSYSIYNIVRATRRFIK